MSLKRACELFVAVTVCLTACGVHGQTEQLPNGGFESGSSGWVLRNSIVWSGIYAHGGTNSVWHGGLTSWSDSTYHNVNVPAGVTTATLSFYYNIVTKETNNTVAFDTFAATIQDTNGNTLATVGRWSNMDSDPAPGNPYYHQKTFDLTPYIGKTVRVNFASVNNGTNSSSFFVDDVSVQTLTVSGPADLLPQNLSVSPSPAAIGGSVTVSFNVANMGGTPAPASHTRVVLTDSANNIFAQQILPTPALSPAGSTTLNYTFGLVGAAAGVYTASVSVDCNSEVAQSTTTNDTAAVALSVQAPAGLMFNATFDSTITNDPNAVAIENAILGALQTYQLQFSDPITVNIQFSKMASGLGESSTYVSTISYSNFVSALTTHAKTTNDVIALQNLPGGTANPVNGNTSVSLTTPNLRALGFAANPPAGQPDSFISLNISLMNLSRTNIDTSKYDLQAVVQHEVDEVLSFGSALNGLTNGAPAPTGAVSVLDLFRYDANGARNFNTAAATQSYLSIDGGTNRLVRFNQNQGADFQDFYSIGQHVSHVQDAYGTPGVTPDLNVELIALDASGYTLVSAVPHPDITGMSISGNTLTMTWASQANLTYQLQYKTNLAEPTWSNAGSPVTATGPSTTANDTISGPQRHYRVAVLTTGGAALGGQSVAHSAPLSMVTAHHAPGFNNAQAQTDLPNAAFQGADNAGAHQPAK
jgi:hypothetical protein